MPQVETATPHADVLDSGTEETLRRFRESVKAGGDWTDALLDAIAEWTLAEESMDGREYRYLVAGEAFDWRLLAERIVLTAYDCLPPAERDRFLFQGETPRPLSDEDLRAAFGAVKHSAVTNFWYGVRVEEALLLAVEREIRKSRYGMGKTDDSKLDDLAHQRIYGEAPARPLASVRRVARGPGARLDGHRGAQRLHLLALQVPHRPLRQGARCVGHEEGPAAASGARRRAQIGHAASCGGGRFGRSAPMLKIVSWNIGHKRASWRALMEMKAEAEAGIALLQETCRPPPDLAKTVEIDPGPWKTDVAWRASVVRLSDCVPVEWLEAKSISDASWGDFAVSRLGSIAAAIVTPPDGQPIVVVSMYGAWERPVEHPGLPKTRKPIWADGSVHRIISDLERLLGKVRGSTPGRRVIAAGDLNLLYGYGEHGDPYAKARYATVFDRMEAIGLPFVGPESPEGGRQAEPWPRELPEGSHNVPTYYTIAQKVPQNATRQLDFVFASEEIKDAVQVRALNGVDEWGPSDHCRIEIEVNTG